MDPTAFDAFAPEYDRNFTQTRLGRLLRQRVWRILDHYFAPGQQVLELACGTGEDAVHLAQRGVPVTATDGSPAMVQATAVKAEAAGVANLVQPLPLPLQEISTLTGTFAGAFSNFGGINTIDNWQPLAAALGRLIRPGGTLILVPMGPYCPWETGWHLLHGQWRPATRRFRNQTTAKIGEQTIPIWYPAARRLRHTFHPWFLHLNTQSLGLWLPPSYLDHLVGRWPRFFAQLQRLEKATAHLSGGLGDHYIMVLVRKTDD